MKCVWEHNGNDSLLYCVDCTGAYTRGESLAVAVSKMNAEITDYLSWSGQNRRVDNNIEIVQEKDSNLQIADADSDVLFDSEKAALTMEEYTDLKALVIKSARDFYTLFSSITNKEESCLPLRRTFYGNVPRTAQEMYDHTKNVNAYYFGEIGIDADNEATIYDCRMKGFELLEQTKEFINNPVIEGSYNELWTVRKMMRRFLWHDRIHAKAMYRMAVRTFGRPEVKNPYKFTL